MGKGYFRIISILTVMVMMSQDIAIAAPDTFRGGNGRNLAAPSFFERDSILDLENELAAHVYNLALAKGFVLRKLKGFDYRVTPVLPGTDFELEFDRKTALDSDGDGRLDAVSVPCSIIYSAGTQGRKILYTAYIDLIKKDVVIRPRDESVDDGISPDARELEKDKRRMRIADTKEKELSITRKALAKLAESNRAWILFKFRKFRTTAFMASPGGSQRRRAHIRSWHRAEHKASKLRGAMEKYRRKKEDEYRMMRRGAVAAAEEKGPEDVSLEKDEKAAKEAAEGTSSDNAHRLNVKTTETRKSKGIVKAAKGKVVKKHADRSSGDLLKAIKAMAKTGYSFDIRGGKFISIKADGEKEIESAELREMCNPVLERHARGIINRYIPGKGCPTKDKLIRDGLWDSMPAVIKDMLEGKAKKKAEKKDKKGSSDEDSEVSPEAASDKSPGASQAAGKQFSRLGDAITALILKGYEYEGILRMLRIGSIYDRGFPVLGDTWKASGTDKEHVNLAARIGSKKNAPVNKGEPTKASLIEEGLWEKFPAEVRRVIETGQDDLFLFCDPAVAEECAPRWDSFPWWLKIMSAAEKTEIVTDDRPGNVSNRNIFDRQKLAWLLSREITGKGNAAPMIERIFYPVRNGYLYRVVEHIARIRVQRKPVVGDIEESVQEYLASKKTEVKAGVPMHLISRRKRDNFDIAGKGEAELPPWINIFEKENYFTMIDRSTALANMPLSILCEDFMGDVYYPYKKFLADDIYWRNKEKEKETIDQRISDFFGSFTHMKHPYKSVTEELLSRFGIAYEPGKHSKEPGLALRAIFDSGKAETLRNKIVAYFSRLEGEKKPVNELYPGDSVRFAGDIWIVKRVDTKNREAQLLSMTSHTNLTLKPDKKKKMVTVLDKASVFAVSDDMPSWAPELSGEAPAGEAVPEAGESGEAAGIAPDSGASEEPLYVKVKDGRPLDNVKDFRNIKDVNELTRGLIEVIMSVLLSRERQSGEERPSGETVLTLAFSSRLSGLEESKLRDVIAEIDRLKKKDGFDKLLKNLRIINSFTGKAQLESELAAGGVSSDNPDTVTFVFAPDDENGELGLTGPNVKYVAINEKDVNGKTFDPMTYYYPLVEIVTLSLMQYHLDAPAWFMHTFLRRQMGMDIGDVNIDDFVDMGTDAFLLFDLIEKVKRHDIDGLPERYVRIQRAFDKAV